MSTWLEVVDTTEDRHQIVDARGRFVAAYPSRAEADAFVLGYETARQDSSMIAASAVAGLPSRIGSVTASG